MQSSPSYVLTRSPQAVRPPPTGGFVGPIANEGIRYGRGFASLYTLDNGLNFGLALIVAGTLANTNMDQSFHRWYQKDVRNDRLDRFSRACWFFGEGQYFIPAAVALGVSHRLAVDNGFGSNSAGCHLFGTFASRAGRAYVVGAPALLIGQSLLGAGRPSNEDLHFKNSHWQPFKNPNGISGHAFVGAIPFMTAAKMTDEWWLRGILYTCSTFTAWSRVNDGAHYLSQAILGWYLAYLTTRAIYQSDGGRLNRGLTLFPLAQPGVVGMGGQVRF